MKISALKSVMVLLAVIAFSSMSGQNLKPRAWHPSPGTAMRVSMLSDNGKWGISEKAGDLDTDNPKSLGGSLIDIESRTIIDIPVGNHYFATVSDVTDDGNIVVGSAGSVPAYWTRATGKWTKLVMPSIGDADWGQLLAVTPDGKYAVGMVGCSEDINISYPVMYDLRDGSLVSLPNMPEKALNGENYHENCVSAISPDGRYLLGMIGQSYLEIEGSPVMWAYVYDREDNSSQPYRAIGYNIDSEGNLSPKISGTNFVDYVKLSPNGEWVTGAIRMALYDSSLKTYVDFALPLRYNVKTDTFEVYDALADRDCTGFAIDNSGVVYGAIPWESPYPDAMVRSGKYFYSFNQIFDQVYDFNLERAVGTDVTGGPMSVSGDGKVMTLRTSIDNGYVLELSEPLVDACSRVNLLGNYVVNPPAGSQISKLKEITVTFDRSVALVGDYSKIKVVKPDNSAITALSAQVTASNDKCIVLGFRTTTLSKGETYTLSIPAGMISLKGDNTIKNHEITSTIVGRGDGSVRSVSVYPSDGANVVSLSGSDNPIVITFDAEVMMASDAPSILLYEGDYSTPKTTLLAAAAGRSLYIFPSTEEYLFKGVRYRVEIPAGVVTDLGGSGANTAMTLNYEGLYVREIGGDDTYIFRADGSPTDYLKFITFDGDENTPSSVPASWGFTEVTPWWGVRGGEESTDLALASHSMYSPAGTSDDWMMTPQLYIPDENVKLQFDAQGYKLSKSDVLKVYVYASDEVINALSHTLVATIREKGELVYDQVVSPGATEEGLDGEWTHVALSLAEYAGRTIYVAFVNENSDQSAIFVDNVQVMRNVKFTTSFMHSATLIHAADVRIEGQLNFKADGETYNSIALTLKDQRGNQIAAIEDNAVALTAGDSYNFSFNKPLSLEQGAINQFTMEVSLNGDEPIIVADEIRNMVFEPTRRIVIEEFTGSDCGNCPQGIRAIENIESLYPGHIIPITLRCYNGDFLGMGVTAYANYLGLKGAPSAMINRDGNIYEPMVYDGSQYLFSGKGLTDDQGQPIVRWLDVVEEQMKSYADADIDFEVKYNTEQRQLEIPVTVRYALNTSSNAVKLFGVVLEDKLETYQSNYFNNITSEVLLPWSKGGALAQGTVMYTFDDVARGTLGLTYSGTGGLLPSDFVAGQEYSATLTGSMPSLVTDDNVNNAKVVVMMIDDLTGKVINANIAKVGEGTGAVESVGMDDNDDISLMCDMTSVHARSASRSAITLEAYTMAGGLIGQSTGMGMTSIAIGDHDGVVVVKATTSNAVKVAKYVVKK